MKSAVKWVQHQSSRIKLGGSNSSFNNNIGTNFNCNWVHPAETLINGRVEYTVKLLGEVEVSRPKGTEVIKEAMQKIKFRLQTNRTLGQKLQRVDICICIDGVSVVDAKSKMIYHNFPLHRISFCADDKSDKRVFSFIAKQADTERHICLLFLSDKLAEEITLTIGEAFDLAYRRYLEQNNSSNHETEKRSQLQIYRRRVEELERENMNLKMKLASYERLFAQNGIVFENGGLTSLQQQTSSASSRCDHKWENFEQLSINKTEDIGAVEDFPQHKPPPVPPRTPVPAVPSPILYQQATARPRPRRSTSDADAISVVPPVVASDAMPNFISNRVGEEFTSDFIFNPRDGDTTGNSNNVKNFVKDSFGLEPFGAVKADNFSQVNHTFTATDSNSAYSKKEMHEGFMQRGLSIGSLSIDCLNLSDFDPLVSGAPNLANTNATSSNKA